jgi:hypothetical protein
MPVAPSSDTGTVTANGFAPTSLRRTKAVDAAEASAAKNPLATVPLAVVIAVSAHPATANRVSWVNVPTARAANAPSVTVRHVVTDRLETAPTVPSDRSATASRVMLANALSEIAQTVVIAQRVQRDHSVIVRPVAVSAASGHTATASHARRATVPVATARSAISHAEQDLLATSRVKAGLPVASRVASAESLHLESRVASVPKAAFPARAPAIRDLVAKVRAETAQATVPVAKAPVANLLALGE